MYFPKKVRQEKCILNFGISSVKQILLFVLEVSWRSICQKTTPWCTLLLCQDGRLEFLDVLENTESIFSGRPKIIMYKKSNQLHLDKTLLYSLSHRVMNDKLKLVSKLVSRFLKACKNSYRALFNKASKHDNHRNVLLINHLPEISWCTF